MNWELFFKREKPDGERYANINTDIDAHKAVITFFGYKGDSEIDKKNDYKKTAKHEMIHLVLARMSELGFKRFVRREEYMASEEEVVQRLLNLIK